LVCRGTPPGWRVRILPAARRPSCQPPAAALRPLGEGARRRRGPV